MDYKIKIFRRQTLFKDYGVRYCYGFQSVKQRERPKCSFANKPLTPLSLCFVHKAQETPWRARDTDYLSTTWRLLFILKAVYLGLVDPARAYWVNHRHK